MKEEILGIASDLREGFITSDEAKELLLVLFGVSNAKRTFCFNCKHDEIGEDMICVDCKEGNKFKAK